MPTVKTLDEAARQLGVGRRTIQRWLGDGLVKPYRVMGDRRRYVDLDELRKLREPRQVPKP